MKKLLTTLAAGVLLLGACTPEDLSERAYNRGITLLPLPREQSVEEGERFRLTEHTAFVAADSLTQQIAEHYARTLRASTGYRFEVVTAPREEAITLRIDPAASDNAEGYRLEVGADAVTVTAPAPAGLFYGMATFMQLLPAEIESPTPQRALWTAPRTVINDAPRFPYRGLMLDVARHFISVEGLKRHIDVLALFKINRLHLHLTDYQGWRIEIKRYPRLTEVGASRTDEYGNTYSGFYTREQMREIVDYAASRYITIIPEIDVPGHSLAAVASYPELSCTGEQYPVMSRWGGFPVVFCPGKEAMFDFLDGVFAELSTIFPSEYFHIGGDECPKEVWKTCPQCQRRIRTEHLRADGHHTAEQRLQSYAIARCEQILHRYGKKMIGWDEILQGGLAPDATVMSWRGVAGGIAAAMMNHDAIMTPNGGLYLDYYQGDYLAEPFAWGARNTLRRGYDYEPVPDTLVKMGKAQYIRGVQANLWSECLDDERKIEYQVYPRILAVAESGWTDPAKKDFDDFSRRVDNAAVRLDAHGVDYHIPLPEQPGGSFGHLAFTDSLEVAFTSSRPVKMVYTLDGSTPDSSSQPYTRPLRFTESGTVKIRSVLPSGTMSRVRTVTVERQTPSAATAADRSRLSGGLRLRIADAHCTYARELDEVKEWRDSTLGNVEQIARLRPNFFHNVVYYVARAEGYVDIAESGVYQFRSDNTRVWIDGRLVVDNDNRPQVNSKYGSGMALEKGLHTLRVEQISNFIGGWNSQHRNSGRIFYRLQAGDEWQHFTPEMLYRER